jgi:hypothetical protein
MNIEFYAVKLYFLLRILLSTSMAGLTLAACVPPTEGETTPVEGTAAKPELCDTFIFDDLNPGDTYVVGNVIVSQRFEFAVQEFVWSNGTTTPNGHALVEDHGGNIGLFTNNVNLNFKLSSPIDSLKISGEYHGGNSNITINGDFRNFGPPSDIDGDVIAGVTVSVSDLGNDTWLLDFTGVIKEFSIGGQEFWIGDVCFGKAIGESPTNEPPIEGKCAEFESQTTGTQYYVGDTFSESGILFTVESFVWGNGTPFAGGFAEIESGGGAGGSGQELWTNNVNIDLNFSTTINGLTMPFGAHGGNLNIEINGDFVNFNDPSAITGTTIGGVNVGTTNISSSGLWFLELSGPISTFAIGGQEFAIDDVCPKL